MENKYDIIIIGAGSTGVPLAYFLAKEGVKVLVIEKEKSPGQGSNKAAIGGIRATHSNPAKIVVGLKSIEIFKNWEKETGDNIEWYQGGYSFVTYRKSDEESLRELVRFQKNYGLNIDFLNRNELLEKIPALNPYGLRGGTYSPEDGSASPLLAINSFYRHAVKHGATFLFDTEVTGFTKNKHSIIEVKTTKGNFRGDIFVNAAGAHASQIASMAELSIPVNPDSHEAGVTEPLKRFFDPMIVDIRPQEGSKNFYFYQHKTGQIIFCLTPSPSIWGFDTRETSEFLPQVARRMIEVIPKLVNIRVRRTWRGLYPMTPDGNPIVGLLEIQNFLQLAGMCGQGFMLGPGLGFYLAKYLIGEKLEEVDLIFREFDPKREFAKEEMLK